MDYYEPPTDTECEKMAWRARNYRDTGNTIPLESVYSSEGVMHDKFLRLIREIRLTEEIMRLLELIGELILQMIAALATLLSSIIIPATSPPEPMVPPPSGVSSLVSLGGAALN